MRSTRPVSRTARCSPDSVLALAGVGDQDYCPYGNDDCGDDGLPCFDCLVDRRDRDG